jgi:hypothetical protein
MSNWCAVRNVDDAVTSASWGSSDGESRQWDGYSLGLLQGWTKACRRELVRLLLVLVCWAARSHLLDRRGGMLWWSYGAFGNKGRLEGAQYLAGRRAPPVLR